MGESEDYQLQSLWGPRVLEARAHVHRAEHTCTGARLSRAVNNSHRPRFNQLQGRWADANRPSFTGTVSAGVEQLWPPGSPPTSPPPGMQQP